MWTELWINLIFMGVNFIIKSLSTSLWQEDGARNKGQDGRKLPKKPKNSWSDILGLFSHWSTSKNLICCVALIQFRAKVLHFCGRKTTSIPPKNLPLKLQEIKIKRTKVTKDDQWREQKKIRHPDLCRAEEVGAGKPGNVKKVPEKSRNLFCLLLIKLNFN